MKIDLDGARSPRHVGGLHSPRMRSPINSPRNMRKGGYDFDDVGSLRSGFSEFDMTSMRSMRSMRSDDYQRYGKRRNRSTCKQYMIKALLMLMAVVVLFVSIKVFIYV